MSDDAEITTVVWTYAGRRLLTGGKLGYAWIDETGEEVYYGKMKGNAIGGQYEVERIDEHTVRSGVKFIGDGDDARTPRWVAEDRSAYAYVEQTRAEKKLARDSTGSVGDLTLRECSSMLVNAGARRHALLALFLRYLGA